MGDEFPFDVVGTNALGHLKIARNDNSHTFKFTAILDWLDNHTSPSAGAQTVAIRMFSGEGRGTKEGHPEVTQSIDYLEIRDDGKGISDLSQALTFADSAKLDRQDDEIGQFGRGLKYATWHLGDNCFIMTIYQEPQGQFILAVALYSYTFQEVCATNLSPPRRMVVEVICKWRLVDSAGEPNWEPWGDLAKFAHSWAVICEYGPMWRSPGWYYTIAQDAAQTKTSEVGVTQRTLFKLAKTLWKSDQPSTGTVITVYNLHPNQATKNPVGVDHSYLKFDQNDIKMMQGGDDNRRTGVGRKGIPSDSLATNLKLLYWRNRCQIELQGKVVCQTGGSSHELQVAQSPSSISMRPRTGKVHTWLFGGGGGTLIKISPPKAERNRTRTLRQGEIYDCYYGKVRPELRLSMPGIWLWVRNRLIPLAKVQSFMKDRCQISEALTPLEGALAGYTVLLLLDDLEVSDHKQKIADGAATRGDQHAWLNKTLVVGGQVYGALSKLAKDHGVDPAAGRQGRNRARDETSDAAPRSARRRRVSGRARQADNEQAHSEPSSADDSHGTAAATQAEMSFRAHSTATTYGQPESVARQGTAATEASDLPEHAGEHASSAADAQQEPGPSTRHRASRRAQGQQLPDVPRQQQASTQSAIGREDNNGSSQVSNSVQQPQRGIEARHQGSTGAVASRGPVDSHRQELPNNRAPQAQPSGMSQARQLEPQTSHQPASLDSQPRSQVQQRRSMPAPHGRMSGSNASPGQPAASPVAAASFYTANSGIGPAPVSTVSGPVIDSPTGTVANIQDCTEEQLRQLDQANLQAQAGLLQPEEQDADWGHAWQDDAEADQQDSVNFQGRVQLTAETFMEALMKVCCDDTQCHMYHPHPLMLLIAALNKERLKKMVAYDVESLPVASGMSAWPQWCQPEVVSPTWQYGLVKVEDYDASNYKARIVGTLINSMEHVGMVQNGSIEEKTLNGRPQFQSRASFDMPRLRSHMATAVATVSTDSLRVLNTTNSTKMVEALGEEIVAAELLLTYGPTNDEQALVRDKHRAAAAQGQAAKIPILKLSVFNMYEACKRLKQAHDCKYNPAIVEQLSLADATQAKQQLGLDAMHAHFVMSVPGGRRFVTPLPEELGLRHTGCHDAAKHLEIILAVKWWWDQCSGDRTFEALWGNNNRMIACTGVEALQLRYDSNVKEYEARVQSQKVAHGPGANKDLVQLQRCDPTFHSYKSAMRVNGYRKLLQWTTDDDQSVGRAFYTAYKGRDPWVLSNR